MCVSVREGLLKFLSWAVKLIWVWASGYEKASPRDTSKTLGGKRLWQTLALLHLNCPGPFPLPFPPPLPPPQTLGCLAPADLPFTPKIRKGLEFISHFPCPHPPTLSQRPSGAGVGRPSTLCHGGLISPSDFMLSLRDQAVLPSAVHHRLGQRPHVWLPH